MRKKQGNLRSPDRNKQTYKKLKHLATRPVNLGDASAFTSSSLEKTRYWNEGNFFSASSFFFQQHAACAFHWSTHAATPTLACLSHFLHQSYCSWDLGYAEIFENMSVRRGALRYAYQTNAVIYIPADKRGALHTRSSVTKKQRWNRKKGREGKLTDASTKTVLKKHRQVYFWRSLPPTLHPKCHPVLNFFFFLGSQRHNKSADFVLRSPAPHFICPPVYTDPPTAVLTPGNSVLIHL